MSAVWVSVSEAAQLRGVSKQAISKRLAGLGDQVSTRRDGQRLMLNIVEWDRVTGSQSDPAQALRNRDTAPSAQVQPSADRGGTSGQASQVYTVHKARQAAYDAENARLDLEERQGKLLQIADVEDAAVQCATKLVHIIDAMSGESEDPKIKAILARKAHEMRQVIADEFNLTAKVARER